MVHPTRADALASGERGALFLCGRACKSCGGFERYAKSKACPNCESVRSVKRNQEQPNYLRNYYKENGERMLAQMKDRYNSKPEVRTDKIKSANEYQRNNREIARKTSRDWNERNRGKVNAATAKYTRIKRRATPPWVDDAHFERIEAKYIVARLLTERTGVSHAVDHIQPLQGDDRCG